VTIVTEVVASELLNRHRICLDVFVHMAPENTPATASPLVCVGVNRLKALCDGTTSGIKGDDTSPKVPELDGDLNNWNVIIAFTLTSEGHVTPVMTADVPGFIELARLATGVPQ
jgi:hypothetical protein